jgi:hypothetical protein
MDLKRARTLLVPAACIAATSPVLAQERPPTETLMLGDAHFHIQISLNPHQLESTFGPRFDATGMVSEVTLNGCTYLGPHGLIDEFGIDGVGLLGFREAGPGGSFIKIGVGELIRPDEKEYMFWQPYAVRRRFPTRVERGPNSVSLYQRGSLGRYGYDYVKKYTVLPTSGLLVIEYSLRNTGKLPFSYNQYNHNWLSFSGRGPGSSCFIQTRFGLSDKAAPEWLNIPTPREQEVRLSFTDLVGRKGGAVFESPRGAPAAQNTLTAACQALGQQIEIGGDFSVSKFALYAETGAFCPEVYKQSTLERGEVQTWRRYYRFLLTDDLLHNTSLGLRK